MNYERKYKEALERAKKLHSEPTGGTERIVCEQIFPELIESEDERIRKELIDFLWKEKIFLQEVHLSVENSPKYRFVMDAIAWLEKQGEKNLANSAKICKENEEMFDMTEINLRELRDRFGEKYGRVGECIAWLKSLKEKLVVK